ncbi:MAG: cell wall hydrolase [Clostridiales bacterium]|nr:cell wall hydrolase [Clostridiales bacterium]MBS5878318.1 cell wall hydrolase [Clostridiales bacterium]MDU0939698.1 cell wall hydrolase [Clostridiales bacterium]MDU1042616.1 cell wall hydrolase [Clostridiales bacterium]MDU3490342.1 cell wall hydrolase [Clostridiales bacterium]
MKFNKLKFKTRSVLAAALIASVGFSAPLLSKISVTSAFADTTKDKLDSAQNEINSLKNEQNSISDELSDLNSQVDAAGARISDITDQINKIKDDIDDINKEISRINSEMAKEYDTMKLRIQYIYESGDLGLMDALISSKDFGDFLAKAEYIQKLSDYDRELLARYDALFKENNDKKASLEGDITRLASLRDEVQSQSDSIRALITKKSSSLNLSADKQAELEALALQYEAQLETERLAAEEAQAKANINHSESPQTSGSIPSAQNSPSENSGTSEDQNTQTVPDPPESTPAPAPSVPQTTESPDPGTSGNPSGTVNASDLAMMAAIIECEAGNQPYEGRIAVGSVIMNRVESPRFDNNLRDVLYAPWQFSPVMSGRFEMVLARGASETNVRAAREVLNGRRNVPFFYFHVYTGYVNPAYSSYRIIEDHIFYNY